MATPATSFNVLVPRGSRIANFLDLIYLLDKNCETQKAVGQVVDFVDGLLNEGEFEECSDVLNQVDVARLSPPIVISILGITRGARPSLRPARDAFFARAESELEAKLGTERAAGLLNKYI